MRPALRTVALIALACAAVACRREEPAPADVPEAAPQAEAAPAAEPATVPGTDALTVSENTQADSGAQGQAPQIGGVEAKDFAGTFAGTTPCADCPGIEVTLALSGDGTYQLAERYQERDVVNESTGTWTAEEAGKRLRLDPDSKDEGDRQYAVVANDQLRPLGGDGKPLPGAPDASLRRR